MPLLLTMQTNIAKGETPNMTKPTEWANLTAEDKEAFLKADLTNTIGLWKKNDAECAIKTSGRNKSELREAMDSYALLKENDEKMNDAVAQFEETAKRTISRNGNDEFTIGGISAEVELFGQIHATAKGRIYGALDNELTEKTGKGDIRPSKNVWISHAIVRASNIKGSDSQAGNEMRQEMSLFSNLNSGALTMNSASAKMILGMDLTSDSKETGLIRKSDMDAYVADLQSRMPDAWHTIGYIPNDDADEFAWAILYDATKRGTPGLFKTSKTTPHFREHNPFTRELLDDSFQNYQHRDDFMNAQAMAFKANVLLDMGLVEYIQNKENFQGDQLSFLRLAPKTDGRLFTTLDWGVMREAIGVKLLEQNAITVERESKGRAITHKVGQAYTVHSSEFNRDTAGYNACQEAGRKSGFRITLRAEHAKDLKSGHSLMNKFFEIVCNAGITSSVMNMIGFENRVAAQADGLPNIGYALVNEKPNLSKKDTRFVSAIHDLREGHVMWPFGWQHGLETSANQGHGKANTKTTKTDGKISKSHGHIRPAMVTIAGRTFPGLEALPLSAESIEVKAKILRPKKNRGGRRPNRR